MGTVKRVVFWATTAVIGAEQLAGGLTDLARGREMLVVGDPVADVVRDLGYPVYLLSILGAWKILGAAVILAPGLPRLKEWAYAGTVFELSGAAISSVLAGNPGNLGAPAGLAVIALASWALRPPNRSLARRPV